VGGEIAQAFRRSIALVCGVNQYAAGISCLRTAVPDVRAVAEALAAHGFEETVLLDEAVTRDSLRGFLMDRATDVTEDDRLVVYFAGHGLSAPSDRGPEGFLLLSDAVSADPTSYFAMAALRQLLEPLRCRHMLLLLDCCFAGTFQWAARRDVESQLMPIYQQTLDRYISRPAWQVLVSACHDEAASDGVAATDGQLLPNLRVETERHSPFAAALLQGLSGAADYTDDGLIVASELEVYIRSYVERLTQARQTPQLYKLERHDRGEFVFQVPEREFLLGDAPALRPENCPYRGAQPFTAEHHPLFFGRRAATQALIERVQELPFTAILGPSGSGKSSLLQAGLIPHLQREPSTTVVVAHAGADLIAEVCGAIPLGNGPSARLSGLLDRIDAWMEWNPNDRLVIVIDDAEQLALAPERARHTFLRDLGRAFDRYATRVRAVFALRSDHEPAFTQSPLCNHWRRGRFEVPPPTQDELREMIRLPARHHELSFEPPSLIDTLINVVHTMPGGLAALSASLHALYVRVIERDEDRLISSADYDAMGGVNGVLTRRASATWRTLTEGNPAYKMTGQRILLRMTALRNGELVRRRVDPSDLVSGDPSEDERGAVLLRTLERDHLMVRDQDGWALAHDALAHIWPELCASHGKCADLMKQVPTLVTAILAVSQATRVWTARAKQPVNLWHDDTRLHHVQRLIRQFEGYFSALEREFIRCSLAQTQRRSRRKFVLAFAALVVCGLGTVGWDRYVRTFDDYYVDYVHRWGAPLGIHPISATEAAHRVEAVKLTRRGRAGRVERAEIVRYGKRCAREHHLAGYQPELEIMSGTAGGARQPCRWEFSYDPESGTVTQEQAQGRNGGLLYTLVYRSTKDRGKVIAEYWGEDGCSLRSGHGDAELVEFHRNKQGLDTEKVYLASGGRTPAVSDRASTPNR
jgi:energy-coupling factor transporter ATP-binding protein EcfA2